MQKILSNSLLKLILVYQHYISPYKGYCCAHSALNGSLSCSSWAIKILKQKKLSLFLPLMKRRFIACNEAHKEIQKNKEQTSENGETVDPCPCANKKAAYCCFGLLPPWS